MGNLLKYMPTLDYKESTAINLKYIGKTHKEIGNVIDVPKATVDEWFKSRGRLKSPYFTWKELMDDKRKENLIKNSILSDNEILKVITDIVRLFNHQLLYGIQKPLIKGGQPMLDENGDIKYYIVPLVPSVSDIYKFWKIQRIMQNKPTNITANVCPVCKRKDTRYL